MKKIVIGLLAHVDAGKTTLAEGLLFQSGIIRKLGRVDHRDSFLDTHALERSRGITIFSKQARLEVGGTAVTLLDTPGHVDFSAETERALAVLDYAVLVISGVDGVQAHTETLWRLLRRYHVPTFLFITKMDLSLKSRDALLAELRQKLSPSCVDFTGGADAEEIALSDESLLERYLKTETVSADDTAALIAREALFPCFFGSGLKLDGVDDLLLALDDYTRPAPDGGAFGAVVYKIGRDEKGNRLTFLKVTGGELAVRAPLTYTEKRNETELTEKVSQIRLYSGQKYTAAESVSAGDAAAVCGLTATYPGMGLGSAAARRDPMLEPVLNYRLVLPDGTDSAAFLPKLRRLEEEIPELNVLWDETLREIHIRLMGEVQIEIIKSLILERFGVEAEIRDGRVLYKETIASPVIGIGHFEPLRHYAEVHLLLEPLEEGSGVIFDSRCPEDALDRNWQRLILGQLRAALPPGVLTGAPLTDLKVTLVAGRAHQKHTEGGDFRQAAVRALRQGLMRAENVLLEPVYDFELSVPGEQLGRAIHDIRRMNGTVAAPEEDGEETLLRGRAPVSRMRNYQSEVIGYTRGRGRLRCVVGGYEPCADQDEVVAAAGYDPLRDTENPSDSVFCAHGGGFSVPWNEVREYAHVDSGVRLASGGIPTLPDPKVFTANLDIDEKEIEAIMEREFGPIKRRRYGKAAPDDRSASHRGKTVKKEYLIVDGYNMIFQWEGLKGLAADDLALARQRLTELLVNYAGFVRCELVLVFDGYRVKGNPGERAEVHGVRVVYTAEGETADTYIERFIREIGPKNNVRVASSDGLIQLSAIGSGVLRVSSRELKEEIDAVQRKLAELIDTVNRGNEALPNRLIDQE